MSHPATAGEPRFLYVSGTPALDLVNTVDWTAHGLRDERLDSYEALTRWAEGAGVLSSAAGRRLRRVAAASPKAAAVALAQAREARGVLQELFAAIARGERPGPALNRFNRLLGEALRHLEVGSSADDGSRFGWRWRERDADPRSVLWPVIWSAAGLLSSEEARGVRVCDGPDCGWMYVDRSRNRLRRWCQMRTCGTREKTRRRRVHPTASS